MQRHGAFDDHWGAGWPDPAYVEPFFLDPVARAKFFKRWDGGSFVVEDLEVMPGELVTVALLLHMNPRYGVKLNYTKSSHRTGQKLALSSKGDLSRLAEFTLSMHETPLSVGLFVPFEAGWNATRHFLRAPSEIPTGVEWVESGKLPPGTFPDLGNPQEMRNLKMADPPSDFRS